MRRWIRWMVEHPTIVNLVMVGMVAASLMAIQLLPKESFPEVSLDVVHIEVPYRGAGAKEIEQGILLKVEDAIQGIAGITKVTGEAMENRGVVRVEVGASKDTPRVLREIKDAMEKISTLPKDAEPPRVYEFTRKVPVIEFALSGKVSRGALQRVAEQVKDQFLKKEKIQLVSIQGQKTREIVIEVDEAALRQYNLQIKDIRRALERANLDLSGGTLKTKNEDLRVRVYAKKYRAKELEKVVIRSMVGGNVIRLRDIGKVRESFQEQAQMIYFDGKPALMVRVDAPQRANILDIAKDAQSVFASIRSQLPPGVSLKIYKDSTVELRDRISLLVKNGLQGLVLVLLVLSFFMNLRLAFWVAAGLGLSVLGSFVLALPGHLTINMISLFGVMLVIGILVDDAIVVAENVYAHYERGASPVDAAINGTMEVLPAVVSAVVTTCLTFLPLFFFGGILGRFIYMIPAMVVAALALSLVESLLILPPHLAHALKPKQSVEYTQSRVRRIIDGLTNGLRERLYRPALRFVLRHRWPTLATALGSLILVVGLVGGGFVKFVFFPEIEGDRVTLRYTMAPGTPQSQALAVARRAEKAARDLDRSLRAKYGQSVVMHSLWQMGSQRSDSMGFSGPSGEEVAEVQLELLTGGKRQISAQEFIRQWKQKVGAVPGTTQLRFSMVGGPSLGKALEFHLLSEDPAQLQKASNYLKRKLGTFAGVSGAEDDMTPGKREVRLKLKPLAQSLGLSMQDVASQVRSRIYGSEVMRLQRSRDELPIVVRYPERDRNSLQSLQQLQIRTQQGDLIPLTQVASWSYARDVKVVRRQYRQRLARVSAELDESQGNRGDIVRQLQSSTFPALRRIAPGVTVKVAGQGQEQAKAFSGMFYAFPLAMFAIFFVLMLIFNSYAQVASVMMMIPFGIVGAVLGHWFLGMPLTILSIFGIVGASGVVVNDSIVMMDAINRFKRQGLPAEQAVLEAGTSRLRAILSTTLTTVVGLLPLLLETSMQAQFLIPMAVSLAFGVLFATFFTLFVMPIMYIAGGDVAEVFRGKQAPEGAHTQQAPQHHGSFPTPMSGALSSGKLASPGTERA